NIFAITTVTIIGFYDPENNFYSLNVTMKLECEFIPNENPDDPQNGWVERKYEIEGDAITASKLKAVMLGASPESLFEAGPNPQAFRWEILKVLASIIKIGFSNPACKDQAMLPRAIAQKASCMRDYILSYGNSELANNSELKDLLWNYLVKLHENPFTGQKKIWLDQILATRQEFLGEEFASIDFHQAIEKIQAEVITRLRLLAHLQELVGEAIANKEARALLGLCTEKSKLSDISYLTLLQSSLPTRMLSSRESANPSLTTPGHESLVTVLPHFDEEHAGVESSHACRPT
ncbi:MAG TPA: hypothetical protein VD770_04620, partial [Coxiellaceae bacterium]|nr:hypothetical protein [Coxiellaceae bacterium]